MARYLLLEAAAALGMEFGAIGLVEGESVIIYAAVGEAGPRVGERVEYAGSIAALAVERGGVVHIADVARDPRTAKHATIAESAVKSVVAMPFEGPGGQWTIALGSRAPRADVLGVDETTYLNMLAPVLSNLVERVYREEQLSRYAFYDMLTELPNRAATIGRLSEAIAHAERNGARAGLFFADMDNFKMVNDTYGHPFGDKVLAEIAHRMRDTMRRDEFAGRLGGDEFAVIFPIVRHDEDLIEVANRIIERVSAPIDFEDIRTQLDVSLGIAVFPEDGRTVEELIAHADVAMYRAKRQSGSQYFWYNRELEEDVRLRHELSHNLHNEQIGREFLLCFQPIVGTTNRSIVGVEALLRWLHPSMGLLSPKRFLDVANSRHLTTMIDSWVVRAAFAQARRWQQLGLRAPIYVNISAPRREVVQSVRDGVEFGEIDPTMLRLELAESLAASDFEATQAFVHDCRENGLLVGLDRFGSGGLPITKLARLQIDFVKLDRDLVGTLFSSAQATAATDALVALAKQFGWFVVAEGVQTEAQRQWLEAKGVDAMQGYGVAHPMTAVDFAAWAASPSRF
ncbi:MAG TPA: EAL domain-containing protein [Candidatus Baltobacteraceae bacterium]